MTKPTSDEFLNAFLDKELAADERDQALQQLEVDDDFKRVVCETRTLKEMVRGAYADLPAAAGRGGRGGMSRPLRQALAAGLLLFLGAGMGWMAHDRVDTQPSFDRLAGLPEGYQPIALAGEVDPSKIVLHLDSNEAARLVAALDLAERLMMVHGTAGRVEIVANSQGLSLLRADGNMEGQRIALLAAQHPNITFVGCGQTLARMQGDGMKIDLLPQVKVAPTGIGEILGRMQQGWIYVKV